MWIVGNIWQFSVRENMSNEKCSQLICSGHYYKNIEPNQQGECYKCDKRTIEN